MEVHVTVTSKAMQFSLKVLCTYRYTVTSCGHSQTQSALSQNTHHSILSVYSLKQFNAMTSKQVHGVPLQLFGGMWKDWGLAQLIWKKIYTVNKLKFELKRKHPDHIHSYKHSHQAVKLTALTFRPPLHWSLQELNGWIVGIVKWISFNNSNCSCAFDRKGWQKRPVTSG